MSADFLMRDVFSVFSYIELIPDSFFGIVKLSASFRSVARLARNPENNKHNSMVRPLGKQIYPMFWK